MNRVSGHCACAAFTDLVCQLGKGKERGGRSDDGDERHPLDAADMGDQRSQVRLLAQPPEQSLQARHGRIIGHARRWVNVGAVCRRAVANFLVLGHGLDEQLPTAVDKPKSLGRIQRLEERADDACVRKPIADDGCTVIECQRGRMLGGSVRRHGFTPVWGVRHSFTLNRFAGPHCFGRNSRTIHAKALPAVITTARSGAR
jgi:hypothetical protein